MSTYFQNTCGITPEEKQLSVSGRNWGEVDLNGNYLFHFCYLIQRHLSGFYVFFLFLIHSCIAHSCFMGKTECFDKMNGDGYNNVDIVSFSF